MFVIHLPDNLRAERTHAVRLVFDTLLALSCRVIFEPRTNCALRLAHADGPCLCMPDIVFANGDDGWPHSAPRPGSTLAGFFAVWQRDTVASVPVLFGQTSAVGQWWERDGKGGYFGIDVLGTAFWMMTRVEEVVSAELDTQERFAARNSHAVRAKYLNRPIVDETVALLATALRQLWPGVRVREGSYSLLPTHDVDRPFKHLFQSAARLVSTMASDVVRRRDIRAAVAAPSRWVRVRRGPDEADPFFTFDWLMDQSERAGLRSVFYFICGHSAGSVDGDYDVRHPRVRALLRRIHSRGHELGVHGSYNTFRSAETLRREFDTLRSVCEQENIIQEHWGGRQHVLRFDSRTTPAIWEAAGLSYDSTLGYADAAGFRCGTCSPFPLYDHAGRRTLKVIERPLVVMDVTLMSTQYEGRSPEEAAERIDALRAASRRVGGEFVLLWHNCHLTAAPWRSLYARTLRVTGSGAP